MTRADIIAALQSARAVVASLEQALAELDGADVAPAPSGRLLDTSAAARLMNRSSSWLYAAARKYPWLGWKLPTGSWVWSEQALLAFRAGQRVALEECERASNSATSDDSTKGDRAP